MLNCHIVRDLLPSYLERLTSPETEAELTEHLSACPDCRAAKAAMEADLGVEKAPKPRLDFLRHLRWQRRLAALRPSWPPSSSATSSGNDTRPLRGAVTEKWGRRAPQSNKAGADPIRPCLHIGSLTGGKAAAALIPPARAVPAVPGQSPRIPCR